MAARIPARVINWKNDIALAMGDAGHTTQSINIAKCAQTEVLLICMNCADRKYVRYNCESRVCPVCSWRLARVRAHYCETMLRQMKWPKFVTLTMPRWTGNPREGITYLRKAFSKLREQKIWRSVKGGVYQIELKSKEDGWHIHIHILMDAGFMPKQKIFSAWRDVLGLSYASVDIRACKTPEQRAYVTKYVAKEQDFHGDAALVVEWYEAVKGSRLFATFGEWYNAKLEDLMNHDEFKPYKPTCDECGAEHMAFFARDGPFIFGAKRWSAEGGSWCGGLPIDRPLVEDEPTKPKQTTMNL